MSADKLFAAAYPKHADRWQLRLLRGVESVNTYRGVPGRLHRTDSDEALDVTVQYGTSSTLEITVWVPDPHDNLRSQPYTINDDQGLGDVTAHYDWTVAPTV